MRARNIAGRIAAAALVICMLSLGALAVGSGPVLAWLLEHPVSRLAGRHISVGGPVTIRWGAPTRLVAENIRVSNASWGSRPDMFMAQRVEIEIAPGTLLKAPWNVPQVSVEHAVLLFETAADGRGNWDLPRALVPGDSDAWPVPRQIKLRDGTLIFHDGSSGAEHMLVADSLVVDAADRTAPIQVHAAGTMRQQPIRISGNLGPLGELLRPTRPYAVALDAQFGGSELTFRGTAAAPLALAGVDAGVTITGQRLDEFAAAFGVALPPLPAFHATGQLTGGQGDWALNTLSVNFGRSDIEGVLSLSNRPPSHARADLTSSLIDLDEFAGVIGAVRSRAVTKAAAPTGADRRIIPAAIIAQPRVDRFKLDLTLHGARVTASGAPPLEDVVAALSVREGRLALAPLTFGIAGGSVAVDLSVNLVSIAPELVLDVDVRRVDIARLLSRAPLPPYAQEARGIAGGFLHARSTGTSVRDFLGGVEGDAGIFAAAGAFSPGLQQLLHHDVLEALDLDGGAHAVPVNCLISRFALKKGVVAASTLLLDTPDVALLGQGNVNFSAETIYIDITPHHKSITPTTVSTPVEVRGTYADATVRTGTATIIERIGTTIEPGILPPPPALQPLADRALGDNASCASAFGPPRPEDVAVGSSRPPKKGAGP